MSMAHPPERIQGDSAIQRIIRKEIWDACHRDNEHFFGAIVGGEGSAKSGTALSICEAADPDFHAGRVCFDGLSFMNTVDSDETGVGSGIMVDEAGVVLGSRTWYDKGQIALNQTLQTIRDDNMFVILTLPRLSELDSQTRGRVQALMTMQRRSDGNWAEFGYQIVSPTRDERDELYKIYPRMLINGRKRRVRRVRVGAPSDDLWREYNQRKAAFKDRQYEDTKAYFEEDDEDVRRMSPREIAEAIVDEGYEAYVEDNHGQRYISSDLIAVDYDIGGPTAKKVKAAVKREVDDDDLM